MSEVRTPPLALALMAGSILGTVVLVGYILVRGLPGTDEPVTLPANNSKTVRHLELGVHARITAGETTIERTFPSLNFALEVGQSLDARIPAGPFKAEFSVTLAAGDVRQANVGAVVQGGSLIVSRRGEPLLSDHAGDEARTMLTNNPESFSRAPQTMVYTFESDGKRPCRLRAMWQPLDSQVPLPLPSVGSPMLASDALRGEALVQQFNCVACHLSSDASRQARLAVNPSPILGDIGARARPEWLRSWLADPKVMNQSAAMPSVFHGSATDPQNIEGLTHFLVSMGGPMETSNIALDHDLISTGMVTYHSVGCMTCHGPMEPVESLPGRRPTIAQPFRSYTSLGRLSQKTTPAVLSKFLQYPLAHWPGGRMPSMSLTELEADGLAHYLINRDRKEPQVEHAEFQLEPSRVERGRELFATTGCANCHSLGPDRATITPTIAAPGLESLVGEALNRGCLQAEPDPKAPRFALSESQHSSIAAYLQEIPQQRCDQTPVDELAVTMARLNCTACHQYLDENGPETAISQYFSAVEEADLGDEGRVPPNLSDVGARLNPAAIRQMLDGEMHARPYMGVRMPVFGSTTTDEVPSCFAAAAGVPDGPDHGPTITSQLASIGRELVGSKGMNCIQCHNVAGRPSTGTPGPDLVLMSERLRYDAFQRWLHDPSNVRPGTRMPSFFFVAGVSGFTQHLSGEAEPQIQAIWAYLSQGEFMPLPDGLTDAASMALQPLDRPIVFRSFLKQGGVRAIACGLPEQIHCSFDAEQCRLTAVWTGDFINASGAWAARGGTQTNPGKVAWQALAEPSIRIHLGGTEPEPAELRFRGYRLDHDGRPIFRYDASSGGIIVHIEEQPIPFRGNGMSRLTRRFVLQGPAGLSMSVVGKDVELDDQGGGQVEVEITW